MTVPGTVIVVTATSLLTGAVLIPARSTASGVSDTRAGSSPLPVALAAAARCRAASSGTASPPLATAPVLDPGPPDAAGDQDARRSLHTTPPATPIRTRARPSSPLNAQRAALARRQD